MSRRRNGGAVGLRLLVAAVSALALALVHGAKEDDYAWVDFLEGAGSSPVSLEKYVHGSGSCDLGTFIKAMPCRADITSPACCAGLRPSFEHRCACRPLPGIVEGHGGRTNSFLVDYFRCNYTDDEVAEEFRAPVDYVAKTHLCMEQPEWCEDGVTGVDLRLDAYERGKVQMRDEGRKWSYVTVPKEHQRDVAQAVCVSLAFGFAKSWGVDLRKKVKFRLRCPPGANSHLACTSERVPDGTSGAFGVWCDGGDGPQICSRANQDNNEKTNVICDFGENHGVIVEDHVRSIGAPTMICGTAGLDESRIKWFDGYQDDYQTYVAVRDIYGNLMGAVEYDGEMPGIDLLTPAEIVMRNQGRIKSERVRKEEQSRLRSMIDAGEKYDNVWRNHFSNVLADLKEWNEYRESKAYLGPSRR